MSYSDKVLDHYSNPRNVGSMDKSLPDVGTGLVGAPECFTGDTLVATADGTHYRTLKDLYESSEPVPVWSFNIGRKLFEIKWAQAIFTGNKEMDAVTLDGDSKIKISCTPDHEFLVRPFYRYLSNNQLTTESIRPFKRYVSERGYWRIRESQEDDQYREIFKFFFGISSLKGFNIHHKDEDPRNDSIKNLERLTLAEHRAVSHHLIQEARYLNILREFPLSADEVKCALNGRTRAEAADLLGIFTNELYALMQIHGVGTEKKNTSQEWRESIRMRMREDNPYHKFTPEQKLKLAVHKGQENGRWIEMDPELLLRTGREILDKHGKLTYDLWFPTAKKLGYPQGLESRFGSFSNFKEQVLEFNHQITGRKPLGSLPAFTLQVEKNNNFVVVTEMTKNIHRGIVVRNCGDVMKLQIKVNKETGVIEDAKFKTFGCGSAIASSSLATEWVKGKTISEALAIQNMDIVKELSLPPVKIHCSVLAEDAIRAAIADWKKKQVLIENGSPSDSK